MAVWTALMAIALVEFAIAQVRRTDNSPMVVRVPYFTWLVIATAVFSYGVARPLANVLDTTDAAVLLTLVSLRTIVLTIVKIQINMTLILTLQRGLHQRQHTRSDDYNTHARSIKRMHVVVRIVSVPNFVLSALAVIVFLSILPNVSGVTSTPVDRLEMFLMAGWLAMAVMILFQLLGGIFNYRIRGIIQENLALRPLPEVATATSPSSSLGVPSAGYTPLDNKMVQLERRMFKNTIRLCIITFVSVVLLFIAAIIGMQYWCVFFLLFHYFIIIWYVGYSTCLPRYTPW